MKEVIDKLPTPLGALDDLSGEGTSTALPVKVYIGHNLGNRTFITSLPMHEFFRISDVANVLGPNNEPIAQRRLDINHARKLAVYMLKGLVSSVIENKKLKKEAVPEKCEEILNALGRQPYMSLQPIVVSIRECDPRGVNLLGHRLKTSEEETAGFKVFLSQNHVLWVIDGQHRRKGMELIFDFLSHVRDNQKYPRGKNNLVDIPDKDILEPSILAVWDEAFQVVRAFCTIAVEVHLGLNIEEERQLFHDLNNLGKKVEAGLALDFDNSNPVNLFIKEELVNQVINWPVIEKDVVDWHNDSGEIARRHIVAINARLFLNKNNISGAKPLVVEERKPIAIKFWEQVNEIPSLGEAGSKMKTVAAQPVMLKALAKLTYDFAFGKNKNNDNLNKLLNNIHSIDLSHDNAMWQYYTLSEEDRKQKGLESLRDYLPTDEEGFNRDIGGYDSKANVMRFGAKHNDIFPILGDMVRWKLGLPNRHLK